MDHSIKVYERNYGRNEEVHLEYTPVELKRLKKHENDQRRLQLI